MFSIVFKLFRLLLIFASLTSYTLANSPETESKPTVSGESMTKWLVENESNFQQVIEQTTKDSKTKWVKEIEETSTPNANTKQAVEEKPTPQVTTTPITPAQPNVAPVINPTQDGVKKEENLDYIEHKVIKNDTLYSIARAYGVGVNDVMKWNKIDKPSAIKVGQVLKIYGVKPQTAELKVIPKEEEKNTNMKDEIPDYKYYKVKKGDTFTSIATAHGMSKEELIQINEIDPKLPLSVDSILKVRSNYNKITPPTNAQENNDGFIWPVVGRLLVPFGPQAGGVINEGINISAKKGTTVKAVQDGIITYVGDNLKSFGNIILIQHKNGWVSAYAHLDSTMVSKGQTINKGDVIGRVGETGSVDSPQLHFELRQNIKPMDPLTYLQSYR
jgi:murein DD-endopeptidase MepM/ murein hydrolase activator NlpD